jgi:hypothetical protein
LSLSDAYARLAEPNLTHAVTRSTACAAVILLVTAIINRCGFTLRI